MPPSVVETLTARGRSGASPHGALGLEEDGDPLVPDHVGTPWSTKRGAAAWEDWAVENTVENREIRRVAAALGLKPDVPIQEALACIEAEEDRQQGVRPGQ